MIQICGDYNVLSEAWLMHPRNVFALKPPVFSELAKKYDAFRKCCFIGRNGKVCVDFKNSNTAGCLASVLLSEYFSLNVNFPHGHLVPRIPQRLNYLLLIEDLLSHNNLQCDVVGVDIGTGASCIYALLGAKIFGWNFYATEIDEFSFSEAKENVARNSLDEKIVVYKPSLSTIFKELFDQFPVSSAFTVCNPPFFNDDEEGRFYATTGKHYENACFNKSGPSSSTHANANELYTEGGEVGFVSNMIKEAYECRDRVKIFTTMVGKKTSIIPLKKVLHSLDTEVKISTYVLDQGRTKRWIIAWTFIQSLSLPSKL